jgi:hypothetical protein
MRNYKKTDRMDNMTEQLIKFLGQTFINLKRSEIAYKNYLQDEKKFIHAKILKTCNEQLRSLLIENSFLLSDTLQHDALTLITHYDIWIEKWNALEQTQKFSLDEIFVFENKHTFPKDAAIRIESEFNRIKESITNPIIKG